MIDSFQTALIVAALVLALGAVVYVALDRSPDLGLVGACAVLEVALVAQLVVGIVRLAGTDRDVNALVFVGYLVGVLLILPAGVLWSLAERSRGATAVLVVAALTVAFLVVRLSQIWAA